MKPKKRIQQYQSSRLFLRNKDHREVVYNDTYHNILYANEIDDPEDPDDEKKKLTGIVWKRYPRLYFMSLISVFEQFVGYHIYHFTVDIDRQYVYDDGHNLFGHGGTRSGYYPKLKDYWFAGSGNPTWFVYRANDGIEFNYNDPIDISGNRYGTNGLINYGVISGSNYNYNIRLLKEKDDGTIIINNEITFQRTFEYNVFYLGPTNDGALFMSTNIYSTESTVYIYKIHGYPDFLPEVYVDIVEEIFPGSIHNVSSIRYCRKGSFLAIAIVYASYSGGLRHHKAVIWSTMNDGETINKQGFIELTMDSMYNDECIRTKLVERNGWFYFYGSVGGGKCYGWKSLDGINWTALNLPPYLDVPTITEGNLVYPAVPEKYRIVIDPDNTPDDYEYTIRFWDLIISDEMFGFKNGDHITKMDMTDEDYLYMAYANIHFYIDNMIFLQSENNFCFQISTGGVRTGVPDTLLEGDYCYSGGTILPYWDPYTVYAIGDLVSYGKTWKCKTSNKNVPPTEGIYWTAKVKYSDTSDYEGNHGEQEIDIDPISQEDLDDIQEEIDNILEGGDEDG